MKHCAWLALAGAIAALSPFAAAAADWEHIGTQQADFKADRDEIKVRGNDKYKSIKLCVEVAPLRMKDLDLVYGNGEHQDIKVRADFQPGSCTRIIDLKGKKRNIDKVVMVYNRIRGNDPAVVYVYAR